MNHRRIGSVLTTLTVLLSGTLLAAPAAARDRGPPLTEADRRFDSGITMRGAGSDRHPGPAAVRGETLDPFDAGIFRQGYEAGRAAERARGAAAGRPNEFRTGLAWNDTHQSEAYERMERAVAELRQALILIGRQPSLPRVQGALLQAREALENAQNALTWLPPMPDRDSETRYRHLRGFGPERASGGWEG